MKLLEKGKNGNYTRWIFSDGTKIRTLNKGEIEFKADYPENIDCKISNKCSIGCLYCHENSTVNGKIADLKDADFKKLLSQLPSGSEIALGGGALTEIPHDDFLAFCKDLHKQGILINATFNSKEFISDPVFKTYMLNHMSDYGFGAIGLSYNSSIEAKEVMLFAKKKHPSTVIHTIVGITTPEDYRWLAVNNFKVLLLGYKECGRGKNYMPDNENTKWLLEHLDYLKENCKTLSFDCLAIEQLEMKNKLSKEEWDKYYMGDDGQFTMYIDAVNKQYAKNSTAPNNERFSFNASNCNLKQIFNSIKSL